MKVTEVKEAQKEQGNCGSCGKEIKAGDSYFWWEFQPGERMVRCDNPACYPEAADLASDRFRAQVCGLKGKLDEIVRTSSSEMLADMLRDLSDDFYYLGNDQCKKRKKDIDKLLEKRIANCDFAVATIETAIDEIEGIFQYETFEEGDMLKEVQAVVKRINLDML